jgi:REP element-mobilizing transposase RayT
MHINFRYKTQIRNKESLKILKRALLNASRKGLRIHHFSMQSNHVHLIVEAKDNGVLSRGMRSLTVTFAKGLKKGRIQLGRYHLHVLRAVSEARNAVRYVLLNEQKHTRSRTLRVDGYSSLGSLGHEFIRRFIRKEKLSLIWKPEGQKINPAPSSWLLKKSIEILV